MAFQTKLRFRPALQTTGTLGTNFFQPNDPDSEFILLSGYFLHRSHWRDPPGPYRPPPMLRPSEEIRSAAQWKAQGSNELLVIEFTAAWCEPCREMEPEMKEFAAKYRDVQFVKIDVDQSPSVASQYGVGTVLPEFVLVKYGRVVGRVIGCKKLELQSMIEKHRM